MMHKKPRKVITLEEKIKILQRMGQGETGAAVAKSLGLNESTVRTIKKNEAKIRESVLAGALANTSKIRGNIMDVMERALVNWFDDKSDLKQVTCKLIKNKALMIFQELKENSEEWKDSNINFNASNGWFERFKKRFSIQFTPNEQKLSRRNRKKKLQCTRIKNEDQDVPQVELINLLTENNIENKNNKSPIKEDDDDDFHDQLIDCITNNQETMATEDDTWNQTPASPSFSIKREKSPESFIATQLAYPDIKYSESESDSSDDDSTIPALTIAKLNEGTKLARRLEGFLIDNDNSIERRHKFRTKLKRCMTPYETVIKDMKYNKQTLITEYYQN